MVDKKEKKRKKVTPPARSGKEERLFQNLLKITEQFMGGKGFTPLTKDELMKRLALPPQHTTIFDEVLQTLIERNCIENKNERYSWKSSSIGMITGTIRMHHRGFGFVQPHETSQYSQDIFIPKHLTKNAVDGDTVEVLVNTEVVSDKGPEGKITAILNRGRTHIAGIVKTITPRGDIIAYAPLLGSQQRIFVYPSDERVLQAGDRIVMEIVDWGTKETETACRMSHYLGHISDPSCDISAAIEEYELRADFPSKAMEEALSFGTKVLQKDIKGRADFRHLEVFTIDPDTAKDYDDALNLTKDDNGNYYLGVHIADVSHYIRSGSFLDKEAQERGNSTYFPNYCLPMIPSALSDNLCSLKPNVNRLTVSVMIRFDSEGTMQDYKIMRSVIKSSKRMTYKEAKKILDGKLESPHAPTLALMVELCGLLKKKRYERGSIEFSLPELVVMVDEKGAPYTTDYISYDVTHQMVEEFMLKANEIVAFHLSEAGKNLTYRIHDEPAEENLKDFSLLAGAFGFRVPEKATAKDLQKLFEDAGDSPYANYLASSYIRRMRLAVYSAENIGHYGLSLTHYCHFTSPIRRYVDLVVHRILFGDSDDINYLQEVAYHCSEKERISAKAENSVVLLKKLRLLETFQKKEPFKEYKAIITKVKNFGFYFEILDLLLEGFIHIAELEEDYFIFEESRMRLKGRHKGTSYGSGDKISVILKDIDLISLETKWYLAAKEQGNVKEFTLSKKEAKKLHKKAKFKHGQSEKISKEKKITKKAKSPKKSKKKKSDIPKKK